MPSLSTPVVDFLQGYPAELKQQVQQLIDNNKLVAYFKSRYPTAHSISNNKLLYDYTQEIKNRYLKKSAPLSKVIFDDKISLSHQALGLHTYVSRVQGSKTKAKNEIRICSKLKQAPEALLRMLVVHELAHIREKEHNKAFYQLCQHMERDYHQLEFDLRLLLILNALEQNPYR